MRFARPTTTPTRCPQARVTTHLVQAIAAAANPLRRPNTARKTSTANPPPCRPNTARQDWDVAQDPADPPRPFNATRKAPATTDPHATSTRRATPRHPQTQCHAKTRPPPTCHIAMQARRTPPIRHAAPTLATLATSQPRPHHRHSGPVTTGACRLSL
ncbi:hypothetical protein EDB89DRAFT_1910565 [Lactarius sanguifluus]|nr:hypothetical protein EDB89DRAFT_1910565 [Lactarius sanguifluus]